MQGGMGMRGFQPQGGFQQGNPQGGMQSIFGNPALRGFQPQGNPAMRPGQLFQPLGQSGASIMAGGVGGSNGAFDAGGLTNANSSMYSGGPMMNGSTPGTGIAPQQTGGNDVYNAPNPVLRAPDQGMTMGQQYGFSPNDPRYNLREGDSYAGGIVTRNPNGGFTIAANNMSGPLAGTSYGQYINPTGDGGIGNVNGQNEIFGNVYHGEGLNQSGGTNDPNSGFSVFLRQQAAAMNQNMPNDPRTQQLNQYLAQLGQGTGNPALQTKPYAMGNPALGRGLLGR